MCPRERSTGPAIGRGPSSWIALFLLLGTIVFVGRSSAALAPSADRTIVADSLYQAGRWADAATLYRDMTAAEPGNGRYWFRYGNCLQHLGLYDDAIRALSKSEEIGHNATVMYNLACAYSKAGKSEEALEWLTKAGDAGFANVSLLDTDEDLKPLKSERGWKAAYEAVDRQARPCAYDERYSALNFWIGDWDVKTAQGQPAGASHVENILGECIIFENWTGFAGMCGKSFNFIDPVNGAWRQTWVDDKGSVHEYTGEFVGNELRYHREVAGPDGTRILYKMTFTNLETGHVRQLGEHSNDEGKSWATDYDLHYWRRKA